MEKCIAQTKQITKKLKIEQPKRLNTFVRSFIQSNSIFNLNHDLGWFNIFNDFFLWYVTKENFSRDQRFWRRKKNTLNRGKSTKWTICVNGISSILCKKKKHSVQFNWCMCWHNMNIYVKLHCSCTNVFFSLFLSLTQKKKWKEKINKTNFFVEKTKNNQSKKLETNTKYIVYHFRLLNTRIKNYKTSAKHNYIQSNEYTFLKTIKQKRNRTKN